MKQFPEKFTENMKTLLGEEYEAFISALSDPNKRNNGLRANTLKIDQDTLKNLLDIELKKIKWCDTGFYYGKECRPAKSPLYTAGLYYIQEPSAMSPASVLPISEGDKVLDVCAAPGGKTTQLAAKLKGTGLIVSNDISASRCIALNKNIENMGIRNAVVTNEKPVKLKNNFSSFFDKILIDAPCSGEGMFRKDDTTIKAWVEHPPEVCAVLQKNILDDTSAMLKNGGMMLYSTCTFNPDENERMIKRFLDEHEDFYLAEIDHSKFGLERGRPEWSGNDARLYNCGRIWPHKADGEGHFMALLQKKGNCAETESVNNIKEDIKINCIEFFHDWCGKYLNTELRGNFGLRKSALYLEPFGMPDLHGIRAYKTGLYLGDLKPKRFEPSTAFALALKKDEFKKVLDFAADSREVFRYLNGESFDVDADEGYNLFCVEGFPLGFGKVINGRLKNRRI